MTPLNASNVARRLWVGGKPPFDRDLPSFDVLVLCANELQPERVAFHGRIVRVPLDDGIIPTQDIIAALQAAQQVAQSLLDGKTVLVTCHMGWNRSALVASLALGRCTRMKAKDIIELMRKRRSEHALSNPYFVHLIEKFVLDGR